MTNEQARALEKEYNELANHGRNMYAELLVMGTRCNEILYQLKDANVSFDEIALLFGCELQIEDIE